MIDWGCTTTSSWAGSHGKQVIGLDQLEPLVHQGRRVDGDLAAHRPVGMAQRLLRRGAAPAAPGSRCGTARPMRSARCARWRPDRRLRSPGTPPNAPSRPAPARCPRSRTASMNISPAHTRHSLLASATLRPCATAASVGLRPAAPMMPAITQSAGRMAASISAAAPAATSMPVPARRSFNAAVAALVGDARRARARCRTRQLGQRLRRC